MVTRATVRSAALTPALVAFVASPRIRQRSGRAFRILQNLDPVHQSPLGILVLSRHAEISAALRNPALGSDESKADPSLLRTGLLERALGSKSPNTERAEFLELFDLLMLFRDPPDHTRLRSLVSKAFTPRRVAELAPRISAIVDELLEPMLARGSTEFMADFAYPFPGRVICELLGIPENGRDVFIRNAPALAIGLDPSPMRTAEGVRRANQAVVELRQYLTGLIDQRRAHPGDDLLSALIAAETDGDRLTHDELVATVVLLVIAGHETTASVLGNAMHRIAFRSDLRRAMADAAESGQRAAVEEFLRLDGPVQMAERITLAPTTIGDVMVDAGRIVILLLAAANRDAAVFDQPDMCRLDRDRNPHVAFGAGAHFCIGAALSRLELKLALRTLAERLPPTVEITSPPAPRRSFTIRGLDRLDLRW